MVRLPLTASQVCSPHLAKSVQWNRGSDLETTALMGSVWGQNQAVCSVRARAASPTAHGDAGSSGHVAGQWCGCPPGPFPT